MDWGMPEVLRSEQYGAMSPLKTGNLNAKHKCFNGKNKVGIKN
jgi:hypothetical protein